MKATEKLDPVIIAGAGPSGLTCAMMLVQAGVPVIVLEREHGLPEDMRASTFHPATLDLLAESGITETLLAQGTRVPRWQYLQHESGERIVFDLGIIDDVTAYPFRLQCEQYRLTSAVVDLLRDNPLFELRRGCRVLGVRPGADGVDVVLERACEPSVLRCRWLVAADGARSTVRKALGLSFEGSVFPKTSITLVLDHRFQDDRDDLLGVNYVWTEEGHYSLMQVRDLWRFSYSPQADETIEQALEESAAQARLQAVFPREEPYRILQRNHYTLHQRCLESFRHGRVLFCGDSAHLNSPSGGMGMNSGIHDAACLVEHLLPVLGGANAGLLDRYDRRRRTIALEETQRLSALNYRRHRETDPELRDQIWSELRAVAEDPELARVYLLDSSMINARRREREID